jgi:D-serine dehydratase
MAVHLHPKRVDTSRIDAALAALDAELLTERDKGIPTGASLPLSELGNQGWTVLGGELPLPLLVINEESLEWNVHLLQAWCDAHDAMLAPHGKTTMSPHLWRRQLAAGAWGMTVANIGQLQVARSFGVPRVLLANEVSQPYDARVIAQASNEGMEILVLVDSVEGAASLGRRVTAAGIADPLPVLVEVGMDAGRAGTRSNASTLAVAEAIRSVPGLRLAGVEGYEGVAPGPLDESRTVLVDRYLSNLREAALAVRDTFDDREAFVLSAGGSMYFDRVVEFLGKESFPNARLILRSGGYVTHDSEFLELTSPLARRGMRVAEGQPTLRPALELWCAVLSRPDPDQAILGFGRRDAPVDQGYPLPELCLHADETSEALSSGYEITAVHDQHAYLRVPTDAGIRVGDVLKLGVSHPCAAFDRWRLLMLVTPGGAVVGGVRTFF